MHLDATLLGDVHEKAFLFFYHMLGPNSPVSVVTIFLAEWFPWILGIVPIVYELYFHEKGGLRTMLRRIYMAPILVYFVTAVIKFFYVTPRPFALLEIPPSFVVWSDPYGLASFPSSHAAFFSALGVTMYFCNPRLGKWFLWGALAIGVARIGSGVHWPIDILGGFIIGITLGYVIEKIATKLGKIHTKR